MPSAFSNLPGVRQGPSINPRNIFLTQSGLKWLATNAFIDGTKTRDVGQAATTGNPTSLLRDGLILGKETASGKYSNSFMGLTSAPYAIGGTTLSANAAVVTELVRRVGASGNLSLTAYSLPIVAVNQIEALPFVDSSGAGAFTLTVEGTVSGAITYSTAVSSTVANINTALNTALGVTGAVVATGSSLSAVILTFSGAGYAGRLISGHVLSILTTATGITINGVAGTATVPGISTTTTAGVSALAGGVRQEIVAYSAATGSTITITAIDAGAVTAVNQVEAIPVVDAGTAVGTFTLTIEGATTAAITYSTALTTITGNINSALNTQFGGGAVVASGSAASTLILTFSGPGYNARPIVGHAVSAITLTSGSFTINGSAVAGTSTTTTAGVVPVAANFGPIFDGALIGDTDGSQIPLTVLCQGALSYLDVTDLTSTSQDVALPGFLTSGDLYSNNIPCLITDDFGQLTATPLVAWIKAQLNGNNGNTFTYSDNR